MTKNSISSNTKSAVKSPNTSPVKQPPKGQQNPLEQPTKTEDGGTKPEDNSKAGLLTSNNDEYVELIDSRTSQPDPNASNELGISRAGNIAPLNTNLYASVDQFPENILEKIQ